MGNHGYAEKLCEICRRPFKCYNITGKRVQNKCPKCQKEYEKIYRKYKQVWGKLGTRDITTKTSIILNDDGELRVKGSKLLEEYRERQENHERM